MVAPLNLPRWLILHKSAANALDRAAEVVEQSGLDADVRFSLSFNLGHANSTVAWMAELLSQYKNALDLSAIALVGMEEAGYEADAITDALDALGNIQVGYLDEVFCNGKPGV